MSPDCVMTACAACAACACGAYTHMCACTCDLIACAVVLRLAAARCGGRSALPAPSSI